MKLLLSFFALVLTQFSVAAVEHEIEYAKRNPLHLTPVPPDHDAFCDGYYPAVRDLLVTTNDYYCWAISYPSFDKEWSIGLKQEKDTWLIEYSVVSERVWHHEKKGDMSVLALRKKVNVERKRTTLDKDVGGRLAGAWRQLVLDTRHPKNIWSGLDGNRYVFAYAPKLKSGARRPQLGTTWSPDTGPPKMAVDILSLLTDLVRDDAAHRVTTIHSLRRLLDHMPQDPTSGSTERGKPADAGIPVRHP